MKWVEFPLGDDRGSLIALEANKTTFYVFITYLIQSKTLLVDCMHLALKQVILCALDP